VRKMSCPLSSEPVRVVAAVDVELWGEAGVCVTVTVAVTVGGVPFEQAGAKTSMPLKASITSADSAGLSHLLFIVSFLVYEHNALSFRIIGRTYGKFIKRGVE
jgi:hypothetical protein